MLLGSPPGAAGNPIGRLPAISVMAPLAGSIDTIRLAPTSATISLPSGASAMPSGPFRSLAITVFSPLASTFETWPAEGFGQIDRAARSGGEADRAFEAADHDRPVLAVLAAGADQRFAAELVDENAAVAKLDGVMRRLEAADSPSSWRVFQSINYTVPVNQLERRPSSPLRPRHTRPDRD